MGTGRWRLNVCGLNHRTSTVEEREPLAIGREETAAAHAEFGERDDVLEGTIVSTCNRTEFYFVASRRVDPFEVVADFYRQHRGVGIARLRDRFYVLQNREAAAHLFRVAGGLDSMVLGENQILGQIKDAYSSACAVKAAGQVIHRLFHQAFRVGKQIRSDTEMGKGACSVASAAMEMIQARLGECPEPTVLFVGVNQMIELAASNLGREVKGRFLFVNRTIEKAAALAERYDGEAYGLDTLGPCLKQADIVVSCTGAPTAVIDARMIDEAIGADRGRRLILLDMAVPRDIDYDGTKHPGVEVFDLQGVQRYVGEQQRRREAAIPQAEEIIARRLDEFIYWYDHVRRRPMPRSLEDQFELVRCEEIKKVLATLPEAAAAEVDRATATLVRRLVRLTAKTRSKCPETE